MHISPSRSFILSPPGRSLLCKVWGQFHSCTRSRSNFEVDKFANERVCRSKKWRLVGTMAGRSKWVPTSHTSIFSAEEHISDDFEIYDSPIGWYLKIFSFCALGRSRCRLWSSCSVPWNLRTPYTPTIYFRFNFHELDLVPAFAQMQSGHQARNFFYNIFFKQNIRSIFRFSLSADWIELEVTKLRFVKSKFLR